MSYDLLSVFNKLLDAEDIAVLHDCKFAAFPTEDAFECLSHKILTRAFTSSCEIAKVCLCLVELKGVEDFDLVAVCEETEDFPGFSFKEQSTNCNREFIFHDFFGGLRVPEFHAAIRVACCEKPIVKKIALEGVVHI